MQIGLARDAAQVRGIATAVYSPSLRFRRRGRRVAQFLGQFICPTGASTDLIAASTVPGLAALDRKFVGREEPCPLTGIECVPPISSTSRFRTARTNAKRCASLGTESAGEGRLAKNFKRSGRVCEWLAPRRDPDLGLDWAALSPGTGVQRSKTEAFG